MQLVDDRGFSNAGISADQHQLRLAARDDAIEALDQSINLTSPSIDLLGNQQPVTCVVFPEREEVDAFLTLPFDQTAAQITFNADGSLVTLLGRLGEQRHDDLRDGNRDIL